MANAIANICTAGEQAGSVAGPVQRSTKVEQFYGKMKVFNDQLQRITENDERMPSGSDVVNILKYFQQSLLIWIKEIQCYFDEEGRQFIGQEHPSVDFNLLCTLLLNSLREGKQVTRDNEEYVDGILTTIACLVPFLSHNNLLALPTKIASLMTSIPIQSHASTMDLVSGYLLPLLLGAMPADYDKEDSRTGLSSPALLLSIFQGCTDQSLYLRIVETLMTYRRSVCGDLLYVMAYGTSDVLEPAIHMLNRYCPAVEIGTVAEYRLAKQQNIILERCNNPTCAETNESGTIRTADLVCLDPNICSTVQGRPPPFFLCTACADHLNPRGSSLFVEIVRSIGNIPELCENPDCVSSSRAGMHFCFSAECMKKNRRRPMRLCSTCNESLHGKNSLYGDHLVHSSLFDLWSMKKPTQTYLVDAMARLLKEANPPFGERCVEMGIDLDTISALQLSDKRDANYYKSITRSLHGLSLLKALSPIPPSSYNYEHMYRLLSMLFAWLETLSFKANIHVRIVEIVERYQTQATDWIEKVQNYDFDLYCDCLLPLPPVQARIGLAWGSLMSETRQLLEGLQRISTLVKLGLLPEKVWERVFPFWLQEIKEKVASDDLVNFKVVLRRLFDTSSDVTPPYALNFIEKKLQHVVNTQRQEGLTWIQMLSAVDISLDVSALIYMFLESSRFIEISSDEESSTMFQFPDPQSFRDVPLSAGPASPSPGPSSFTFPSISLVHNTMTYYILMMDILIKQISLRKVTNNSRLSQQESFCLTKLLVVIADRQKEGNNCNHSTQKTCQYCQLQWIFYTQISILLDRVLPTISDLETKSVKRMPSRTESTASSMRSKYSSNASVFDKQSLRRKDSVESEISFDEVAASLTGHISSTGVDDAEAEMSADDTVVSEESQDSLLAWRNKIKGIAEGTVPSMRASSIEVESNTWNLIYDAYPEIELTMLLLQHIFKYNDPVVLCNILKCISMTCVRGECLRISTREDMDLTHYLQTVLFIPSLWEMLQSNNSCLAQQAVPLLLHCICMPYGASRLCDEIENVYNNEDWMKRFSAVEKVSLLCQFIAIDIIRDSAVAKSTLVHAFVYLISAIDDVHNAVAAKARTMLTSINETALKQLYIYMDEHFKYESSDRLMLLHAWRTLDKILEDKSPYSNKFFRTLMCVVITKAKSSLASSSRGSSISSTKSDSEALQSEARNLVWSRALSSPGRATGIANWINSGKLGMDRPRSSSVPLVLYKQKYTLQFDRQQSLLKNKDTVQHEEVQRTSSGRQRKNWSPGNDPFNKGNTEPALLGGRIEGALDQLEEDDTNEKRKSSTASSSTASSCSKSTYLHDVDNVVLHHIICLMMEYLSHSQAVNAKKCRIEDLRELMTTLRTCLTALTSAKNEEDLSFKPQELRKCTVFTAFMFRVPSVLDNNPYVGQEFLTLMLTLMLQCIGEDSTDSRDLLLADLDPPLQQAWLMNLLLILYKYEFNEHKGYILPLIWTVINTINSHKHHNCVNILKRDAIPQKELNVKSFPRRVRAPKASKLGSTKKRGKSENRLEMRVLEMESSSTPNDSVLELSMDSRLESRTTETSYIDQSGTSVSLEDSQLTTADSVSTISADEEFTLRDVFNSQRCFNCHSYVTEYEEDIVILCVVVLSTFVHRDPEMAAPLLMEILCTVSRKALHSQTSAEEASSHEHHPLVSVSKQFIRCVFVQLSPNGLFSELFRCEIFDKDFFAAVVDSLLDFDMLDEMEPLKSLLQDFSSRSHREDRVPVLLKNVNVYVECLPKENIGAWENILHDFESFFKALHPSLPATLEATSLLHIIRVLLSIGKHYAKSLLPSFGNAISHIIRKCDFHISALHEVCYACNCAFSKEREKNFLARAILQDLALTMKYKVSMHERNVKKIIQLIYLDGDSWFSFEAGDSDIKKDIPKLNIGVMSCIHGYQQDLLDCIRHWDYRIKDIKDSDDDYLDDNFFPVQLKASLAQIIALYLSTNKDKAVKASIRTFAWLRNPPSQLGRIDLIQESVANLRTFAWMLLSAINHLVDNPDSHKFIHLISLNENAQLIEYVRVVLQSLARQSIEQNNRHLLPSMYVTFITCQLWTIYCESHLHFHVDAEADVILTVMEFWSQITFTLVQMLNANDKVKLEILIPFVKIMKGISSCCEVAFSRLTTLWCPLVQYYKNEIPENLYNEFKELQRFKEKTEKVRIELDDVVRHTRSWLAKLERAGNKFDHSLVV